LKPIWFLVVYVEPGFDSKNKISNECKREENIVKRNKENATMPKLTSLFVRKFVILFRIDMNFEFVYNMSECRQYEHENSKNKNI